MKTPHFCREKLENRYLFNALPLPVNTGDVVETPTITVDLVEPLGANVDVESEGLLTIESFDGSPSLQSHHSLPSGLSTSAQLTLESVRPTNRLELVFIDSKVENAQAIRDLLSSNGYVVNLIPSNQVGLNFISQVTRTFSQIDAVHIFSNGDDGTTDLGSYAFDYANYRNGHSVLVQEIGRRMSTNGDILFYSSSLAESESSKTFLDLVATRSGADIAASTGLTGSTIHAGNWELEHSIGTIETNVIRIGGYEALLSDPKLNTDIIIAVPAVPLTTNVLANDFDPKNNSYPFDPEAGHLELVGIYDSSDPRTILSFNRGETVILKSGTKLTNLGNGNVQIELAHGPHTEERLVYEVDYADRRFTSTIVVRRDTDADGVADIFDVDDDNDGILDVDESPIYIRPGTTGVIDRLEGTSALYATYSQIDLQTSERSSYVAVINPFTGSAINLTGPLDFQINAFAYNDRTDTFFAMVNSPGVVNGQAIQRGDILEIDRNGEIFFVVSPTQDISHFHPLNPGGGARSGVFLDGVMYVMPNNATGAPQFYSVDVTTGATKYYTLQNTFAAGYHIADLVEINGELYGVARNFNSIYEPDDQKKKTPFYLTRIVIDGNNVTFVNKEITGVPHVTSGSTTPSDPQPNYNFDAQWAIRNSDGSFSILFSSVTDRNLYRIDNYLDDHPVAYLVTDGNLRTDTFDGANSNFSMLAADNDGDGIPNHLDLDSDNDGIPDNIEAQSTAGYIAPTGIVNEFGLDLAYVPTNGLKPVDTDGDGLADFIDVDSDNDGILDIEERGDLFPTVLPTILSDQDFDGLLDVFERNDVVGGIDPTNASRPSVDFYAGDTRLFVDASNAIPLYLDLDFRKVNHAPTGADRNLVVDEDGLIVLTPEYFGFQDTTESTPHDFINIDIISWSNESILLFDGVELTSGTRISVSDILAGRLVWRPKPDLNGDSLSNLVFHVQDSGGTTNGGVDRSEHPNTLTLDVRSINDSPKSTDLAIIILEDQSYQGRLPDSSDIDNDTLTYALSGLQPSNGIVSIRSDGHFVYTPRPDYHGQDFFYFEVSDGTTSNRQLVTITVEPVSDAINDERTIPWNTTVSINALENDLFTANATPIALIHGVNWIYSGQAIDYDLNGLTHGDPNHFLVPGSGAVSSYAGTVLTSTSIRLVDELSLSWTIDQETTSTSHDAVLGAIATDSLGSAISGKWFIDGVEVASGVDLARILLSPTSIGQTLEFNLKLDVPLAANTIHLHLLAGNQDSPQGAMAIVLSSVEYHPLQVQQVTIIQIDGITLSAGESVRVPNGYASLGVDGNINFSPDRDFYGTVAFDYTATSGGRTETATITIEVVPVPRATDDHYFVSDVSITSNVLANDNLYGRPSQPIDIVNHPQNGSIVWSGDGTFTYTPNQGVVGTDIFTYRLQDGGAEANVYLTTGFGKDSFTDLSVNATRSPFDLIRDSFKPHYEQYDRAWIHSEKVTTLRSDPMLAGYATPKTILVAKLYSEHGTLLSEVTTQANAAGNWVLQFWGIPSDLKTRVVIEHIATEDVALGELDCFKLASDLYRSFQLEASHSRGIQFGSPLAGPAGQQLENAHRHNLNPLSML